MTSGGGPRTSGGAPKRPLRFRPERSMSASSCTRLACSRRSSYASPSFGGRAHRRRLRRCIGRTSLGQNGCWTAGAGARCRPKRCRYSFASDSSDSDWSRSLCHPRYRIRNRGHRCGRDRRRLPVAYWWRAAASWSLRPVRGDPVDEISGRPLRDGRFSFSVSVADLDGNEATRSFELIVDRPPPRVEISRSQLPRACRQQPYEAAITATGGRVFEWQILVGPLPPGLELLPEDGRAAIIVGTPTEIGFFRFELRAVSERGGEGTRGFVIDVVGC